MQYHIHVYICILLINLYVELSIYNYYLTSLSNSLACVLAVFKADNVETLF